MQQLLLAPALFLPGYLFLRAIAPQKLKPWPGIALSIALSFLIAYPLQVLNVALEQSLHQSPFQWHLDTLVPIFTITTFILAAFAINKEHPFQKWTKADTQSAKFLLAFALIALLFRLLHLDLQNINGDEQELSLYAYHLVDGMVAGRNAFFVSQTGHSPLGFHVSHLIYQILSPHGYDSLSEWTLRAPMLFFGILEGMLFLIFAQKLKIQKNWLNFGLIALAVNTYAIFGSRLMIPQDLSVFTFFTLIFVYFLSEDDTPAWLLGLLLAATLLVKFSAILLIPVAVIYWLRHKKAFKGLAIATGSTLFFFSPVIAYNIASYLTTGYTDVPFAKVFNLLGLPANSIMGNAGLYSSDFPPFTQTLLGFLTMLADMWGLLFFGLAILATLALLIKPPQKKKTWGLLALLTLISLLFFGLNGYRAYYAEYLSIPAILAMAYFLPKLQVKALTQKLLAVLILLSSALYSVATHWVVPDPLNPTAEYGRERIFTWQELQNPFSLGSWSFLTNDGFPELQARLQSEEQLLVIQDKLLERMLHQFRWYLHIHRDIEAHYISDYQDDYNYIQLSEHQGEPALLILPYTEEAQATDEIISNSNGVPKFILRQL